MSILTRMDVLAWVNRVGGGDGDLSEIVAWIDETAELALQRGRENAALREIVARVASDHMHQWVTGVPPEYSECSVCGISQEDYAQDAQTAAREALRHP